MWLAQQAASKASLWSKKIQLKCTRVCFGHQLRRRCEHSCDGVQSGRENATGSEQCSQATNATGSEQCSQATNATGSGQCSQATNATGSGQCSQATNAAGSEQCSQATNATGNGQCSQATNATGSGQCSQATERPQQVHRTAVTFISLSRHNPSTPTKEGRTVGRHVHGRRVVPGLSSRI